MPPKQSKESTQATREAQNRAAAVRQARIIQERKELQNRVLDTIIEFVDFPSSSTAEPASPSATDLAQVKQGLSIFQQCDYDDLVTERNISDKCGYVLCPRPVIKDKSAATDRIIWSKKGDSDLKIVPKAELDRWCSKECGHRAVFLRAQLNESPVWVSGGLKEDIVLLDEVRAQRDAASNSQKGDSSSSSEQVKEQETQVIVDGIRQLALRDGLSAEDEEALRKLQQLTLERGKTIRDTNVEEVNVVEKSATKTPRPPAHEGIGKPGTIDGYQPKSGRNFDDDDNDDDGRDILDL